MFLSSGEENELKKTKKASKCANERTGVERLAQYIALFHAPYFRQAPLSASAPRLDIALWRDMTDYEAIDADIYFFIRVLRSYVPKCLPSMVDLPPLVKINITLKNVEIEKFYAEN